MMRTVYFQVAEHGFAVMVDETLLGEMTQYAPFAVDKTTTVFTLKEAVGEQLPDTTGLTIETTQDDDGSQIVAGHMGRDSYFEFLLWGKRAARMLVSEDYREATVWLENNRIFGINNALMVMFALATADKRTVLFHSSVVSYHGRGYMFLGKSGTGKSTHSSLWLRCIDGSALVNDDNPVVRVFPDGVRVFGSPWSGKTPCYRCVSYPLGGIVQLSQAPYNKIRRLKGIEAYASLVPSISGKRWDKSVADGLHETENELAKQVAVWYLECLPDEAAAQLCNQTIAE